MSTAPESPQEPFVSAWDKRTREAIHMISEGDMCHWTDQHDKVTLSALRAALADPSPVGGEPVAEDYRDALAESVTVYRYKNGNTALLEALMGMVLQHCTRASTTVEERVDHEFISANENAVEILERAGMLIDGKLQWEALEARKPKQQTWEQAVNECITDPARRAELLSMEAPPAIPPRAQLASPSEPKPYRESDDGYGD